MSIQAYKYINLNDGKILLKKINIQDTEYKITNKPNGDKILEKINKNQPDIDKTKQVNTIMNYISKFIENGNKILNDGNNILHLWRFKMPIFQQKNKQKFGKAKFI